MVKTFLKPRMPTHLQIRSAGVSVVVLRGVGSQTETLLLRRAGEILKGAWCQVAGVIEQQEAAWETALRELQEETGLVPEELHSAGICEQFYDARLEGIYMAPVFVAFVDTHAVVTLNREHSEYRWIRLEEVDEYLATPNQREMFAHIRRHFVERKPTEWSRIDFKNRGAT